MLMFAIARHISSNMGAYMLVNLEDARGLDKHRSYGLRCSSSVSDILRLI